LKLFALCGYVDMGKTKKDVSIVGWRNVMTQNKIHIWKKHQILCAIYNEETIAYLVLLPYD